MSEKQQPPVLDLTRGELVEIRSVEEILATLDGWARYEGVPFMPEMLAFAGRRFRVSGRADRTCDRVERKGLRAMTAAVHLEGVRCNGAAHDGCEAACLIYWKEAWLKRVGANTPPSTPPDAAALKALNAATERIYAATRKPQQGAGAPIYSCQATESLDYTSALAPGTRHSYWHDVRCGNVPWHEAVRTWLVERFNAFQGARGGTQYPPLGGSGKATPTESLNLQPGELVQVRQREEIFETLDSEARNRGLSFDREMLVYCGGSYRVLQRVTKIIDEPTGRMIPMKRDCVILDGVICQSRYHGLCQRAIYPFWREIWLRRTTETSSRTTGEGSFVGFVAGSFVKMVWRRLFGRRQRTEAARS